MKVLVIGSGGREHAIAWALARDLERGSPKRSRDELFCAPGNAGTETFATNVPLDPEDPRAVVAACRELGIGFVIPGPETSLAAGLVDSLESAGIPAFGPKRDAALLESSKAFARAFSERYGVPCARTDYFDEYSAFCSFLDANRDRRLVLKKSGLAAGKGVLESSDYHELSSFANSVLENDSLLVEEFLVGQEFSLFVLCTGNDRLVLPVCADHKKSGSGDTGKNTGGMGAICPVPFVDAALMNRIEREIVDPTFRGMETEGLGYRGVLFFGIMVTIQGPKLLEYNVRFGDPETQSLLPLLESSFLDLSYATATSDLASLRPVFSDAVSCGVVIAAAGYPELYSKGLPVELERASAIAEREEALLFHASTVRDSQGTIRTGGGRCFTAVGVGPFWSEARARAYAMAASVNFEGAWYRDDIGAKVYGASRANSNSLGSR